MDSNEEKRFSFFEQLGAPTLLFRNVDSYHHDVDMTQDFGPSAVEDFWEGRERVSRAQARHYFKIKESSLMKKRFSNAGKRKFIDRQKMETSRRHLSLWMKQGSEKLKFDSWDDKELSLFKWKLSKSQRYDSAYLRSHQIAPKPSTNRGIRKPMLDFSRFLATKRRDHGDPVYMAPFPKDEEYQRFSEVETKSGDRRRMYSHPFGCDHPNRPSLYGNCLTCFHCSCSQCRGSQEPTACLLHPVGRALDKVRLSIIALPQQNKSQSAEKSHVMELDVGESIRQLRQCGNDIYMARTDLFCVFFTVLLDEQDTHANLVCRGWFKLSVLHRVDLRSLSRFAPSYIPSYIACHPKYGSGFTKPRSAIVSACQKSGDRVTVHMVQCGDHEVPITKHRFNNLHDISTIEFTMNHPMVLWSAARSHVHPISKVSIAAQDPQLGFGTALFCLDARSQLAVFQWSPSREEFATEGVHGLSGIHVDEKLPHSLWASSSSAGKVWEIDSRMPSSPVTTWSLANACDGMGVVLPPTAQYGAGNLFSRPIVSSFYAKQIEERHAPLLSVSQDPGAFSLNVYQRPLLRPRFETSTLECIPDPNLILMKGLSAAPSSIFPLPDISDKVFVTGLASFYVSPSKLLSLPSLARLGCVDENHKDAFCAIIMNNRGDVHVHTILDGGGRESLARLNSEFHAGGQAIPLPEQFNQPEKSVSHSFVLHLGNDSPTPASAFTLPATNHDMRSLAKSSCELGSTLILSQEDKELGEECVDRESVHETDTYPSVVHVNQSKLPSAAPSLPTSSVEGAKVQMKDMEENHFIPFGLKDLSEKGTRSRSDMSFDSVDKVSKLLEHWGDFQSYDI